MRFPFDRSLSIVVSAHNEEATLPGRISRLLEVACELTPHVELLIVDDGSTDDTADVAGELARRYPQIRYVRHEKRRGPAAAVQSGLSGSSGDVVHIADDPHASPDDLARRWHARNRRLAARTQTQHLAR